VEDVSYWSIASIIAVHAVVYFVKRAVALRYFFWSLLMFLLFVSGSNDDDEDDDDVR
jgi:hypothetical protein